MSKKLLKLIVALSILAAGFTVGLQPANALVDPSCQRLVTCCDRLCTQIHHCMGVGADCVCSQLCYPNFD